MKYIGLDGCKGGWFLVGLNQDKSEAFTILKSIHELTEYLDKAELVLLDIPIGLRGRSADARLCDKGARALLRPVRSSSVFLTPSRSALECASYEEASSKNKEYTGRRLSKQTWAIAKKIREVDVFLRQEPNRHKVREMHPEICFWALNGRQPMSYNKKTNEGYEQRISVLELFLPSARKIVETALNQYPRKMLARDDIVDAVVGAVTALLPGSLQTIPDVPEVDETGLSMEMVYKCAK